jgi:hypothetical protein
MATNLNQFISGTVLNASSLNVLFSSAVSSGSLIVVHVGQFNGAARTFSDIVDNVNANAYTVGCNSTMTSDTAAHAFIAYKAGISSGGAASTYRVSVNLGGSGNGGLSAGAFEYTGGPWTVGSTKSANGTSSSPAPGATTASSTPVLFVMSAIQNSTATFNSTINTGAWRVTIDPTNANQVIAIADSTNSSLTQNPTFGLSASTRWLANSMIFMGLGSGGAAARPFVDGFSLTGVV